MTSCSLLKKGTSIENEKLDVTIFNKGVSIFEVLEETSFDYELKNIDTTTIEGKIKYENSLWTKKEDILDFAFEQFEEIINTYPKFKNYIIKSLYNLAQISSQLDYEKDEIKYLQMILNSNANDKENSGKNGLMANPYANFKNKASSRLTEIYIVKGNFKVALDYKLINEKYPFQHFCGNAFSADEIYNAKQYARIYIGLGNGQRALNYLLPHIFNNELASNSELIDLTIKFLKDNYSQEKLIKDFENSTKNIYSKIEKNGDNEWTNYYINFFLVQKLKYLVGV